MRKPLLVIVGTRAEAIKLVPVYIALKKAKFDVFLCATFQHFELLKQVFDIFDVIPDFNLGIMKDGQDLFYLTKTILEKIKEVCMILKPFLVIVHGDTTTTMASALAAFYLHIPIAHIEAGLRTGNMRSPFPEEMNRKVVGQIATYHFTPTALATANILQEGVPRQQVFCTGNPVVDALYTMKEKLERGTLTPDEMLEKHVANCRQQKKQIVLLTAHRRESFDGGLKRIFTAVQKFAETHADVYIFYPVHPNPQVIKAVKETNIKETTNVLVTGPLLYKDLVYLLTVANFVVTDSGGVQEEAVSLGVPVLCLRDVTERWEGVWEGREILVGTDPNAIMQAMEDCYRKKRKKNQVSAIYGDGHACQRIVSILKMKLHGKVDEVLVRHNFTHEYHLNKPVSR